MGKVSHPKKKKQKLTKEPVPTPTVTMHHPDLQEHIKPPVALGAESVAPQTAIGGLEGIYKTIESLASIMEQSIRAVGNLGQGESQAGGCTIDDFMDLSPPHFKSALDPLETVAWVTEIEKIFDVLNCTDEQKVSFATYMLKRGADGWWWDMNRQSMIKDGKPLTWERLLEVFYEKYFPESEQDQIIVEFLELVQGDMTVAQYEAKFVELYGLLARFAPSLVANENRLARKFERGLRQSIRIRMSVFNMNTYAEVFDRALIAERDCEDHQRKQSRSKFDGPQNGKADGTFFNRQGVAGTDINPPPQVPIEACRRCGKNHGGHFCYLENRACFEVTTQEGCTIEQFMDLDPPVFSGALDPLEAEEWVSEMEKIFCAYNCTDKQKVSFATFMLVGKANDWLKMTRQIRMTDEEYKVLTWQRFLEVFFDEYFPESVQDQTIVEFMKLEQGNMTVAWYDAEFLRLASLMHRFAPDFGKYRSRFVRKFERGLRPSIRYRIPPSSDLTEIFNSARTVESVCEDIQRTRDQRKRSRSTFDGPLNGKTNGRFLRRQGVAGTECGAPLQVPNEACQQCGKNHGGHFCSSHTRACFGCGKVGHMARDCPSQRRLNRACFGCGKLGHMARDCPS